MKILFDQGTPVPLRGAPSEHKVVTAFERGRHRLQNGDLLIAAESAGFHVIVTTDKNLRYQQNLAGRNLAILVLSTTDWRRIRQHLNLVTEAVDAIAAGAYIELSVPSS